MHSANIIGSGPNGLAAAITLAQAGVSVTVFERNAQLGGACSTGALTLPGFHHDLGASAFPMGFASPCFNGLDLAQQGFAWKHPELPLAHPLDDGTAVALTPSLAAMDAELTPHDAVAWHRLLHPLVAAWPRLVPEILGPVLHLPRHPLVLARFGVPALLPAATLAGTLFQDERTRALFAGCAAHSVMRLDAPLSAAVGIVLATAGHAGGWPVAGGGSQALSEALAAILKGLGGRIELNTEVCAMTGLPPADATFFDTSVKALERIAADRLSSSFRADLRRFKSGPGAFKVDWALSEPIPWRAEACRRAGTIHVGGTLAEIAGAEAEVFRNRHSGRPFVLLVQPSVCDSSRAPSGRHTAWGYCHVPNGSSLDQTAAIEAQVERFAPGFRDTILARQSRGTAQLEAWNPNLTGGDLSGGAMTARQMLFRPTARSYGTSDARIFLCSSATAPGGGVHGMCGFHAAKLALERLA